MSILEYFGYEYQRGRTAFIVKLFIFLALLLIYYLKYEWYENIGIGYQYLNALLFYIGVNLTITVGRFTVSWFYIRKIRKPDYKKDNFLFGLTRIATIINAVVLIIALFIFFDIDYIRLFTSLSIIAAAIAILSKDYIANMINGMIIMFNDQITLGDFIQIGNHRGTVVDITFINIHIMNENDDLVYFPNSLFFSMEVVNFTKRELNKINIYFVLGIDHLEYVEKLEALLIERIEPFQSLLEMESCFLRTVKIEQSQVEFSFQYVIKKHNAEIEREIRKTVMRSLVKYLK